MINIVLMVALAIFAFLSFSVYPSPAMIIMWSITALFLMMSMVGVISITVVFLMFMFYIIVLMVTGVFTEVRT